MNSITRSIKQHGATKAITKTRLALAVALALNFPAQVLAAEVELPRIDPNRSQKWLVLEDGVPVAPGLFLANESYYSPRIERMQSIEVLKGAAGLRFGPTTIGGRTHLR